MNHPLRPILNPRSVAVIGASADPSKFGGRVMTYILKHGFDGEIFPVNPGASSVMGLVTYPTISAAPGPIGVALLAVPAARIASTLEECGAAGVRGCIILSADFAEAGAAGVTRQEELVRIARAHRMRLIGPNCLGFINPSLGLALTSSVALAVSPMPGGAIGLISQSGSLMASLISHARDLGAGFSIAVSVGNQADLEICDFIEYFIADPGTLAICVYAEGLKDGKRFLAAAAQCRAACKPLLVVKAGRSDAGAGITVSHTASLAGSAAAWEAACRAHAVILLDDPESLIQCAHFLIRSGAPDGDGVAALSPSGGTIAVTADRIADADLRLARPSPATAEHLHQIVPATRPVNPLDVGGLDRERGLDSTERSYMLLAEDNDTSVVLIVVATTPQLTEKVALWGRLGLSRLKPTLLLLTPGSLVDDARSALCALGAPFVNRMDDAMRVVKAAIRYGCDLRQPQMEPVCPFAAEALDEVTVPAAQLTESETKGLLRRAGIATTTDQEARSAEEAVRGAREIGYPVALKLVSRAFTHKSEVGGVKLGLVDDNAVTEAWSDISAAVAHALPAHALECVVQAMAGGGVELIVGSRWDDQFGAVVMVGAGGIWVEALADTELALAPVSADRAHAMLEALRIWPLLAGARGQPAADVASVTDAIVRVSWIAAHLGPRLTELDINPLLAKPAGSGAIALDARATLHAPKMKGTA